MKYLFILSIFIFQLFSFSSFSHDYLQHVKSVHEVNDTLPQEYKILSDSNFHYDFGESCYLLGKPPLGRKAIETLRLEKRTDLIKAVLNGNNNEGRIYAIEALLQLHEKKECVLTDEEKDKIKLIILSNHIINRCKGNVIISTPSIELFKEDEYKKLLQSIM